ncbi:MAG TPA: tetratricopeptide repeat protein [Candidatus Hydrogenedentes bacterium]|nr:tetratricopeptide repeat protein [Candidatus Hydrogenedentota bacterium]HOZ49306.1 tetratricopeptide repeat protein [Candidatus Hydrogenedentota bacterium]HPG69659.1 tetratricopeptide repeat protein [Candidatus Hydrogenedentota bacterium]
MAVDNLDGATTREKIIRAVALAKQARYAESVRILRSIVADHEENSEAWYGLAYCYYRVGNLNPAKALAQRAMQLGNPSAPSLISKIQRIQATEEAEAFARQARAQAQAEAEAESGIPTPVTELEDEGVVRLDASDEPPEPRTPDSDSDSGIPPLPGKRA